MPAWLLPTIIAAAGGAQAIFGGKASRREEAMLKRLERRMNQGLDPAEIGRGGQDYAAGIARGVNQKQRLVARGYGASGGAGSTFAMSDIKNVGTVGEGLTPIIAEQDLAARRSAETNYMNLEELMTSRRRESVKSGLGLMGSAAGMYLMGMDKGGEIGPHGGEMIPGKSFE